MRLDRPAASFTTCRSFSWASLLAALDKKLREEMHLKFKRLHTTLGVTALHVTYDQEKALTMSDRIVLLIAGRIEQMGAPDELYFQPRSSFAAEFLGDSIILAGNVRERGPDGFGRDGCGSQDFLPVNDRRCGGRSGQGNGAAGRRDHAGGRGNQ